jgi:tRNA threonylcarbamoyladenosine biosynthesis protein TsaB
MIEHTLAIEGSTYGGSVALLSDHDVIAERTLVDGGTPSRSGRDERVLPSVAECLEEAGVKVTQITRVVCGAGPGSFTSLRISASVAKGIAVGIGCPVYSVSSLLLSIASTADAMKDEVLFLSVLPAMREEWFALLAEVGDGAITPRGDPFIVGEAELAETARRHDARLVGPRQEIVATPHARGVATLLDQILAAGPIAIETWEPDYGRLAEAQVKWEAAHGRPLGAGA